METTAETSQKVRLTSAEIGNLWTSYMSESMVKCILTYFLQKVEDTQIRPIIEYALHLSQKHIQRVTQIFKDENYPIPHGFTDHDVHLDAPRLYSDAFFLVYVYNMSNIGMNSFSMILSTSARADVRDFYTECLASSADLYNKSVNTMLSKGLFRRPPYISAPQQVEFVQKRNFLTGWFGNRRPLTAIEITNLVYNIKRNTAGKALLMGFGQVATSQPVREYMAKGKDIASKHFEIFSSLLHEDDLPSPMTWDSEVTNSTIAPFSDKLMMFHTTTLIASSLQYYGAGLSTSSRRDLSAHYTRLMAEIAQYAEDGANMMIDHGWMEQPPTAEDRKALARV